MRLIALLTLLAATGHAQWTIQDAPTTASLRGIHSLGNGVAWASGSEGTVLHTEDGGTHWLKCSTPPDAAKLDFRGIQAFDARTAIAMSSGKGTLSRLYKTTDAGTTWKLVFTDPDATGFFDSLGKVTSRQLYLLGDPVAGKFAMFYSADAGDTWFIADDPGLEAPPGSGAFAASNSSFLAKGSSMFFGAGGGTSALAYYSYGKCPEAAPEGNCPLAWGTAEVPLASGSASAGIFSLAARTATSMSGKTTVITVAVGGVYDKPEVSDHVAASSSDGAKTWHASQTMPSGYRSAIAFDFAHKAWITVGPNGTDLSTDDGKNWRALKPAKDEAPDADRNWNALSLPFVVGPKGRIGKLNDGALKP